MIPEVIHFVKVFLPSNQNGPLPNSLFAIANNAKFNAGTSSEYIRNFGKRRSSLKKAVGSLKQRTLLVPFAVCREDNLR